MNKRIATRIAAGVIGVGALLGATPAFALTAWHADAAKVESWSSEEHRKLHVYDMKADSRSVFGEYFRAGDDEKYHMWNKSGSGTVVVSNGGNKILQARACRQEQWNPDECGAWKAN
ncbi:hypothetical protein ACH4GK_00615 [Streptomyces rimosus]|uniref:hypothetical protein n=1 Tax=Streptomyces TaxID=1883 RepID=UPI0004C745B1|nr:MULTISPECIES: hypothetical protein [Streptomyces]KOT99143.1 hypothetical protein ADK70_04695 [Streptomyces rimosus subsp. pseudoverticillatus]RSO30042.1 hypothetical protein DMH15_26160 [Streptomyces sp. WAC 06725]